MEVRTKYTEGTETSENLEPAVSLASPPLRKAAAHGAMREQSAHSSFPGGQRLGTGPELWHRIKAAHSAQNNENGGGGVESCSAVKRACCSS